MTQSKEGCPDGWDPAELLAYLEEDVGPSTRAAVEEHLKGCSICSDELDSLRRWDALLREHPESFHPDPEDLYRLVSRGEDPAGHTKSHVESCRDCTEALNLLREMLSAEAEASEPSQVIPGSLVSRLEELYRIPGRASHREPLSTFFHRLLGIRLRLPVLALGTAAAVVIIVALVMPRPAIFKEHPRPGAVAPVEAPRRSTGPEQRPSATDQFRLSDGETRETRSTDQTGMSKESPAQPSLPPRSVPLLQGGASEPETHRADGDLLESAPRKTSKLRSFTGPAAPEGQLEKKIAPPPAIADIKSKSRQDLGVARVAKPVPSSPKLPQGTGIPVRVQIVDSAGHLVPGLRFVPPKSVDSRFSFSGPTRREENVAGKTQMKSEEKAAPAAVAENEAEGYLVVVTVKESQGFFDIDAKLFEAPSAQGEAPTSTMNTQNVSKEDLQSRIGDLVFSLLGIE
jgi:anti-sigma factor RsiW